jgi:protein CpxP
MKLTCTHTLALLTFCTLAASSPIAEAADPTNKPAATESAQPKAASPAEAKAAETNLMVRMTQKLKLTDKQVALITPILKERSEKLVALREDKTVSAEDRKAKSLEIRTAADGRIKPLLTGDQPQQWEQLEQEWGRRYRQPKEAANGTAN